MFDSEDLQKEKTLKAIIETETDVLVLDGESVGQCSEYESVLRRLDGLSSNAFRFARFAFEEGDERRLQCFGEQGKQHVFRVAGGTDWIDHEVLVQQLNAVLEAQQHPKRFVVFSSKEFGQEIGFAFLPEGALQSLATLVHDREEIEVFEQLFPDGEREPNSIRE